MKIDDSIARDYIEGAITSKAFKAYLKPLLPSNSLTEPNPPHQFSEECTRLLHAVETGFRVDEWEGQFLADNIDNMTPSSAQIARLDKISRRRRQRT